MSCCRRKGAARLARPPEGRQGPGPTCQRPAGRSPAGEKVGHLLALITQCQPGWESRNPDVPSCRDVWKRGAVRDAFVEVEHAAHPGAPCALTPGSRAHIPTAHGPRPASSSQKCSSERFGPAGPQAAWGRLAGELGKAAQQREASRCPRQGRGQHRGSHPPIKPLQVGSEWLAPTSTSCPEARDRHSHQTEKAETEKAETWISRDPRSSLKGVRKFPDTLKAEGCPTPTPGCCRDSCGPRLQLDTHL